MSSVRARVLALACDRPEGTPNIKTVTIQAVQVLAIDDCLYL